MEYRKIGDNYYIRMDRGDEIICNLLEICEKESIPSAVFSGIGGCQSAELQVFIPETGSFETEQLEGMLELVSLNGNVVRDDDGKLFHHTHALFSFKKDVNCVLLLVVLSEGSLTLRLVLDSGTLKIKSYGTALGFAAFQRKEL